MIKFNNKNIISLLRLPVKMLAVAILLMAGGGVGSARQCLPDSLLGTMALLELPSYLPAVPDSLTPVFLTHIGRHGARFMTSDANAKSLQQNVDKSKLKTREGVAMLRLIAEIDSVTADRWGQLTAVGEREQCAVADLCRRVAPRLFDCGNVCAVSTYVPRAVMSMYSMCHRFSELSYDVEIATSEGREYDGLLRFFKTDSVYARYIASGDWHRVYDEYVARHVPTAPAERLLGQMSKNVTTAHLRQLTMDIYAVIQSLPAAGIKAPDVEFLTPEEMRQCYYASNLSHALVRADNHLTSLPDSAAAPLLRNILDGIDNALNTPGYARASLRFAHAETVMPLFSLMRLPGCFIARDATPEVIARGWKTADISPLGANLIVVIYAAPSGRHYARVLLNGRDIDVLGRGDSVYVPWSALHAFWLSCLPAC